MSDTPRTDALCHENNVLRIEDAVELCRQLERELIDEQDKYQGALIRIDGLKRELAEKQITLDAACEFLESLGACLQGSDLI